MLTINLVFILRKSVNCSVNLFSNRNMNSASVMYSDAWVGCDVFRCVSWCCIHCDVFRCVSCDSVKVHSLMLYKSWCIQVRELSREDIEKDLTFVGFIIISCPLKPDSKAVIKEIRDASHHVSLIVLYLYISWLPLLSLFYLSYSSCLVIELIGWWKLAGPLSCFRFLYFYHTVCITMYCYSKSSVHPYVRLEVPWPYKLG